MPGKVLHSEYKWCQLWQFSCFQLVLCWHQRCKHKRADNRNKSKSINQLRSTKKREKRKKELFCMLKFYLQKTTFRKCKLWLIIQSSKFTILKSTIVEWDVKHCLVHQLTFCMDTSFVTQILDLFTYWRSFVSKYILGLLYMCVWSFMKLTWKHKKLEGWTQFFMDFSNCPSNLR